MDHQGAGFAFDSNMDFTNMFAATPETLFKPADNTSGLFFSDEGIDTTTSSFIDPTAMNTPQHGAFDMPIQHTAAYFPPTPTNQFLDAMPTQFNAYGKRPLQLEADDFPQSKRQASYDFPLFPTPPATTSSSWGLEPTPSSTTVEGLSDEAADVCATWFTKYNVLPGDRHIDSLSQLTGEPADAIRSWFGQLLKQGMGKGGLGDSAYKSQTSHMLQQESFWNDHTYQTDLLQASPPQPLQLLTEDTTPEVSFNCENPATTTLQSVVPTRSCKKRCTPTDDLELLGRDPRKIYQCTRKCGKRYGRKNDWKRKEEEGYPCKSWVCSLCISEGVENVKPCYRKYHFVQHFRNIHANVDPEDYEETSVVYSETEFPRKCGFCRHRFSSRQERIDHIADHFKQGKCMLDWRDDDDENNDGDDSTDDDNNDDRPSGDGFDGQPSQQPPSFDPRGGNGSNQGSGRGSGSAGPPPQSGFFHFQLSQLGESQRYCADQPTKPITLSPNISQSQTSPESGSTTSYFDSIKSQSPQAKHAETAGDYAIALAGDAFTQSVSEDRTISMDERRDSRGLEHTSIVNAQAKTETRTQRSSSAPLSSKLEAILDRLPISGDDIRPPDIPADPIGASHLQAPQTPKSSNDFHSIKLLGAGGFSTVDEVMHQQTGLRVGRKTLKNRDRTALEELKKEVNVLQKLRHPHIIRFLGAYSKGDKMSILLSPVADTTLAVWLGQASLQRPANLLDTIVKMFGCLASSVRYLHEQRPVVKHMDIKPQNILILEGDREFPHVVLSDFGVSSTEEVSDDQTRPWTRQYVAPEVFEGLTRKQAADIWSLGCVFAEMASVPLGRDNTGWLDFSKAFSGRTGTYYWQDVPGVQSKLAAFLDQAKTATEQVVVRTLQAMLSADPDERPDAASLTMTFTPAPCCLNWPNDKVTFPGPHEELVEVEKIAHQHGIASPVKPHIRDGTSDYNPKIWLDECMCSHGGCLGHQKIADSGGLPKRLIDTLPEGQAGTYVKIVDGDDIRSTAQRVLYAALSHVWSEAEPLLRSDSLSRMQTELGLQTLPLAVRNAISEAQRLGFRYCWLDSLCVLQDSEQDKEQECTNMSSTFRNATLTIVVDQHANVCAVETAANNKLSGMTDKTGITWLSTPKSTTGTIATRLPAKTLATPNLGWDTRAWVLQDRLLSRRFLYLGEQLYWECNTLKASQTFPQGLPSLLWEKVHTQYSRGGAKAEQKLDYGFNPIIIDNSDGIGPFAIAKIKNRVPPALSNWSTTTSWSTTEQHPPFSYTSGAQLDFLLGSYSDDIASPMIQPGCTSLIACGTQDLPSTHCCRSRSSRNRQDESRSIAIANADAIANANTNGNGNLTGHTKSEQEQEEDGKMGLGGEGSEGRSDDDVFATGLV